MEMALDRTRQVRGRRANVVNAGRAPAESDSSNSVVVRSELYAGSFADIPTEQGSNVGFRKTRTIDEISEGDTRCLHEF